MTPRQPSLPCYFWAAVSLLLVISFVYANAVPVPFLFDDDAVILKDQLVKSVKFYLTPSTGVRYRHIYYLSFALNYYLGQFNALGYHLANISLHILTSLTIFFIAFLTIDKGAGWGKNAAFKIALIATFLFALNPVHSETVTYISGRASGLSAFFYCLALLLFILGSLKNSFLGHARFALYPLSLVVAALAVLSKETTVTFPLIAILYDVCFMRGEAWGRLKDRLLWFYLPVPALGCFLLFKASMLTAMAKWWFGKADSLYALLQVKIINFPIKLFFLPINLTFDYNFSKFLYYYETSFILSVVFLICLLSLAAKKFFIKSPVLSFSILWYFITMLPTNSFIPRVDLFSERNLYLPSIGLSLFFAVAFHLVFPPEMKKNSLPVIVGTACLAMILIFDSILLIKRNSIYLTEISLWEDTVKKSPDNPRALQNLSRGYLLANDYRNAFPVLRRMKRMNPSYYFTRINLGRTYVQFGQLAEAEKEFSAAIDIDSKAPEAYFNLGSLYAATGHLTEAKDLYKKVDLEKLDIEARQKLILHKAEVDFEMKLYEEAENGVKELFKIADASKVRDPEASLLLGKIYSRTGREALAIEELSKVQGDEILESSAHNSLGLVYIGQTRQEEALREFERAISLNPRLADAKFNLGKLLLEIQNDRDLARKHLSAALDLTSNPEKREVINKMLNH